MALAALFVCAYLLGAIPFGVLVARAKGVDIRKVGSGNIGATNVHRALGAKAGLLVFVLDVLKGLGPTLIARLLSPHQEVWFLVGFTAVLGHSFSPFLGFKGGKGISTALGMVVGSAPWVAVGALAVFILMMIITRYVSLSSMAAALATVVFGVAIPGESRYLLIGYAALVIFVFYRHRANIGRLRQGTEPKFQFRKAVPETPPEEEKE